MCFRAVRQLGSCEECTSDAELGEKWILASDTVINRLRLHATQDRVAVCSSLITIGGVVFDNNAEALRLMIQVIRRLELCCIGTIREVIAFEFC